jgi:hypothetical protein
VTVRAVLALTAYLLVFPLFVLGPLAGLLLASRPTTAREWAWVVAALAWCGMLLAVPAGIAGQTFKAWGLFVTAGFVVLMFTRRREPMIGACLASLFGFGAVTFWNWSLGTRWRDVQLAVEHAGWELCRQLLDQARAVGAGSSEGAQKYAEVLRLYAEGLAPGVSLMADLYPGLLFLGALPGLALAWAWYHRVAVKPVGAPSRGFAEFRFSDQLVWVVLLAGGALLVPLPPLLAGAVANVALVAGGLYAARGAAILWGSLESFPTAVLVIMFFGVLLILPVAVGGCFAIGLADTWVDFRRRFAVAG